MSENRLPTDRSMAQRRDLGQFVCRCSIPELVWLALWRDYQCGHCGKAVIW